MFNKIVRDLMTPDPCIVSPEVTVDLAARKMKDINCGVLPVGTSEDLVGILTDRDIVLRIVAEDIDADSTRVKDIMTSRIYSCHEDDTLQEAAAKMIKHKVGRLVVRNKQEKLVGILSFGGIVRHTNDKELIASLVDHVSAANAA